jgi:hypothetical protein
VIDPEDKLQALFHFANKVADDPQKIMLLGFLTGRVEKVHFVEKLDEAPTQIFISARRFPVVPAKDFEATVNGVQLATPIHIIRALAEIYPEIALKLDFNGAAEAAWFQRVLVPSLHAEETEATTVEQRIEELKKRVDDTLDLYNEIRRVMETGSGSEEEQLEFFLTRAKNEMQALSAQLGRLREYSEKREGRV